MEARQWCDALAEKNSRQALSTYRDSYCKLTESSAAGWSDEKISEIVAEQMQYDDSTELVRIALDTDMSCFEIHKFAKEQWEGGNKAEFMEGTPYDFQKACPGNVQYATASCVGIFCSIINVPTEPARKYILNKLQQAYQNEKLLQQMKQDLQRDFKESEKFWNGSLGTQAGEGPFDLIVDLNLIEKMLFGDGAEWLSADNVFMYSGGDGGDSGGSEDSDDPETEDIEDIEEVEGGPGVDPSGDEIDIEGREEGATSQPECTPIYPNDPRNSDNSYDGESEGTDADPFEELFGNDPLEEEVGGNQCIDPEMIIFTEPPNFGSEENDGEDGSSYDGGYEEENEGGEMTEACPPGTRPVIGQYIDGPTGDDVDIPQAPEYPGPNIGGTLKKLPESSAPKCGPNESTLKETFEDGHATDINWNFQKFKTGNEDWDSFIDSFEGGMNDAATLELNELKVEGDDTGWNEFLDDAKEWVDEMLNMCIPTEFCATPDMIRNLFNSGEFKPGTDWAKLPDSEDSDYQAKLVKKFFVESIEWIFCAKFSTANRPTSPYSKMDGCIDCHITAMTDILETMTDQGVAPLENTTGAWALSSRWTPNFSIGFSVTQKRKKPNLSPMSQKEKNDANDTYAGRAGSFLSVADSILSDTLTLDEKVNTFESLKIDSDTFNPKEYLLKIAEAQKEWEDTISSYTKFIQIKSAQTFAANMTNLFSQWGKSFAAIDSKWMSLAIALELNTKNKCKF